jgi:hypothetical protein
MLQRTGTVARKHAPRRRPATRQISAQNVRAGVAAAFRRMAHGVNSKAAYASSVAFYRSGGQEWAKQLG